MTSISSSTEHPTQPSSVVANDARWVRRIVGGMTWRVRTDLADKLFAAHDCPFANWQNRQQLSLIKSGPMRSVARLQIGAAEFFVKRFRTPDWRTLARNLLRGNQAQWEASRIRLLMERDVPTAPLVAVAHSVSWSLSTESAFITESLVDAKPLDLVLSTSRSWSCAIRGSLIESVGELAARLHHAHLVHHDLHAGNVLVRRSDDRWEAWLIDVTKLRTSRSELNEHQLGGDLALLFQTTRFYCDDRDRLRFWRRYWQARIKLAGAVPLVWNGDRHQAARALLERARRYSQRLLVGMDRRWADGNHHQIEANQKAMSCRGLAWLGREVIERWRDHSPWPASRAAKPLRLVTPRGEIEVDALCVSRRQRVEEGLPVDWARQGWEIGHALQLRGIPAAQPLMFVIRRDRADGEQLLITRRPVGQITLNQALATLSDSTIVSARTRRETGLRIAGLLRAMHDAGFVQRVCSLDDFGVTVGEVPVVWEDLSTPNPLFGAALLRIEQIEQSDRLDRERLCKSLGSLVVSVAEICWPSRSEWLRWLRAYLTRSERIRWKVWWRETARHSRVVMPLRSCA